MALAGLNLVIISLFAVLLFFLCNNFILDPLKRKYQLREKKILEFLIFNSIIVICFFGSITLYGLFYYILHLLGEFL